MKKPKKKKAKKRAPTAVSLRPSEMPASAENVRRQVTFPSVAALAFGAAHLMLRNEK